MYSIYVTNKSGYDVYIRLKDKKLSAANPNFHLELADNLRRSRQTEDCVNSYLVRWGFCVIPRHQTVSFAIDITSNGIHKYASLYAASKLWTMDFEMNCIRYGCLFINGTTCITSKTTSFHLTQANPESRWIPAKKDDKIQRIPMKAGPGVFFGRSTKDGTPCIVTATEYMRYGIRELRVLSIKNIVHGCYEYKVELLYNTAYELVRAQTGDLLPPHAVITGVSEPEGSLFLGRVGGNTPCPVSTSDGKIKSFYFRPEGDSKLKKVQSGEILVLTNT